MIKRKDWVSDMSHYKKRLMIALSLVIVGECIIWFNPSFVTNWVGLGFVVTATIYAILSRKSVTPTT